MRLKAARMLLRTILVRASNDPAYMQQLRSDPVSVLVEAGLPYDVIEDFLRETNMQAEVSAYGQSDCATTCAVTKNVAYPEEFRHYLSS